MMMSRVSVRRYFMAALAIIIVLSLLLPALLRRQDLFGEGGALTINGVSVGHKEFALRLQAKRFELGMMQYQLESAGLDAKHLAQADPQEGAIESLVNDQLLNEVADSMVSDLDDEYVATKLRDPYYVLQELSDFIPTYMALGMREIDSQQLGYALRNIGWTVSEFERVVEQSIKRSLVKNAAMAATYLPSFMIKEGFLQRYAAKKFSVIQLSLDAVVKEQESKGARDADLKDFFEKNKKRYQIAEKRSGVTWEFSADQYGITISDQALKDYYDNNKSLFMSSKPQVQVRHIFLKVATPAELGAVRAKMEKIREDLLKDPAGFQARARAVSENKETAHKGGDLGFIGRSEKGDERESAAFKLKQDGDISEIIKTKDGFEILQRVSRKPAAYKSLDAVKGHMQATLLKQEFKRRFLQDAERLAERAQTDPQAVKTFVGLKKGVEKKVTNVVLDASPVAQKLFKAQSNQSVGYYRDEDKGVLVQLTDVTKSYIPEFVSVRDRVEDDLYEQRARQEMVARVKTIKDRLKHESVRDVAATYKASVKTIDWLKSDDTKRIDSLSKDGLPVTRMVRMEYPGSIITSHDDRRSFVVVLDEREQFNQELFKEKKQTVMAEMYQEYRAKMLMNFIASLRKNATIKINEKTLQKFV